MTMRARRGPSGSSCGQPPYPKRACQSGQAGGRMWVWTSMRSSATKAQSVAGVGGGMTAPQTLQVCRSGVAQNASITGFSCVPRSVMTPSNW